MKQFGDFASLTLLSPLFHDQTFWSLSLDSFSTLLLSLAVLFVAWPRMLLLLSLSSSTFFLLPMPFPLQGAPFVTLSHMLPFLPSSITDTPCTCAPLLYTYSTLPSALHVFFFVSSILLHISLLYLLKFQIYFGELIFLFLFLLSCSIGLSVQTPCTSSILFLVFLLTLPLVKRGHAFLWANCSWHYDIVVETS